MDPQVWAETTKDLVDEMAKNKEITQTETMLLLKFAFRGQRTLTEKNKPQQLRVAS